MASRPKSDDTHDVIGLVLGGAFGAALTALLGGCGLTLSETGGDAPAIWGFVGFIGLIVTTPLFRVGLSLSSSGALAGSLGGAAVIGALLYTTLGEGAVGVWEARTERPLGIEAVGSWQTDDLVIRARPDRVTARALSDGTAAWSWAPPGRDVVCAMSRETTGGVGLIGHAPEGRPCTTVRALDLTTGGPRWTATLPVRAVKAGGPRPDLVAAGHGLALLPTADGWRALDAKDGKDRWLTRAEPGCVPLLVHTDPDNDPDTDTDTGPGTGAGIRPGTLVTVADCGAGKAPVLRTLAPGTGRQTARAALPARGVPEQLAVLSARPLAVWVWEREVRGTRAVLSYDELGKRRATIPASAPRHELRVVPALGDLPEPVFAARPTRTAVVVGDTLVMPGVRPGDNEHRGTGKGATWVKRSRLVGHSLATGRRLWTTEELKNHLHGLTSDGSAVWALKDTDLLRIDPRTGRIVRDVSLHELDDTPRHPVDLRVSGDRYTLVNEDGTNGRAPVRVLRHS
ncbi:PQQ-binding-like beta-propeller repeat protein [Streptomyces sp. R302]|uniref:PQQ-binding-like beta-propeller repeat protein n=1 Tax=unclassified Streptomyces TaxID=2593676 RepID=UPI00145FA1C7|nr:MULTISPECIES: PQQ-binding-like beta-propeller repeat protein [unclassified Streptomyces]NML50333.1 PQQ-binding-like beta-propeller repeat protein [Streptomyces sp. R301]NML79324.1 PQQ-binding-like beta-propeller repeat protein [Streptomyces sp. R302]